MVKETDEWGDWEVKVLPNGAKVRVLMKPSSEFEAHRADLFELGEPLEKRVDDLELRLTSVEKTIGGTYQ